MALTGLQIFKHLPGGKKEKGANCKNCGFSTCMAFAMKLAKKEAAIDKCEFISDELRTILEEANQLQQAEIIFGPTDNQIKAGNEIVMFRHEKKFVNPACLAIKLDCSCPDFDRKLDEISNYSVERVGEIFKLDAIALFDSSCEKFIEKAQKIAQLNIPLILASKNIDNIRQVLEKISEFTPLVYLYDADIDEIIKLQAEFNVPTVISGMDIESLAQKSSKALENKAENIVLNLKSGNLPENLTYIRRSAIENKFRPLGFPVITFMNDLDGISDDVIEQAMQAAILMCKYSNIVVLDKFDEALIYSLITLRQNIFTDPEKPLQIEPKIYPIGDVDENSPVIITTNFALTYFTVVSEIESSNIPAYLLITPSDGMSVLTAWAASKFTGEIIAKAVREFNLESLIKHRKMIIPGHVACLKEEIEEELPDWKVIVGANEAVEISDFLAKLEL